MTWVWKINLTQFEYEQMVNFCKTKALKLSGVCIPKNRKHRRSTVCSSNRMLRIGSDSTKHWRRNKLKRRNRSGIRKHCKKRVKRTKS